jgi:hypothetical protein
VVCSVAVVASYALVGDGIHCDYDPIKKAEANTGSGFLDGD